MATKLLDISFWQDTMDFTKLNSAGYDHIILRAGYGTTKDSRFDEYAKGCQKAGINVVGVYWFIYATNITEVQANAKKCLEVIKPYKIPIVFCDFEYDTVTKAAKKGVKLGAKECDDFTITFCEAIKKAGYTPGYYANTDYYKNMYSSKVKDKGYVFWLAHYLSNNSYHTPPIPCDFFQYTDRGTVPGLTGKKFDTNVCFSEKYLNLSSSNSSNNSTNTSNSSQGGNVMSKDIIQKVIDDAVAFAVHIANDNSHGYSQQVRSLFNITNPKSFDCSSLVITSFYYAFIKNGLIEQAEYLKNHCSYTGNMMYMTNCGFEVVARNQTAHASMVKGDIELNTTHHTALAIDKDNIVHARTSEGTSNTTDDSGNEIRVQPWYLYSKKWDIRLRFTGKGIDFSNLKPSNISLPSSATSDSSTKSYLSLGDTGSEVKSLQQKLNKLGYKGVDGKSLTEDGQFGNNTEYAVRAAQGAFKLSVDGKAGQLTLNAINDAISALQKPTKPSDSTTSTSTQLIKDAQIHLNNFTGSKLTPNGKIGAKTKKAFISAIQIALNKDYGYNFSCKGVWGDKTELALSKAVLKKGMSGYLITVAEIGMLLNNINPNGVECPGSFGEGLYKAIKKYQANKGLVQDGIIGINTWKSLCK